jgi:tRNA threonylcarbamoyladenosine biosynthesis protein TsaB
VIVLALDTASPSTVAGVMLADGSVVEERDDPPEGSRGEHASRLLVLAELVLARGGVEWRDVDRIAVGLGPGGFTGLRIGIATARALAQARGLPLVGVGSLEALALGVDSATGAVAAVLDARRGEVFAGVWQGGRELVAPAALAPEELAGALAALDEPVQAVGEGAVRFREELERAGVAVPEDGSRLHRISAAPLCRLGAVGEPADRDRLLPDYRREPDAKPRQR